MKHCLELIFGLFVYHGNVNGKRIGKSYLNRHNYLIIKSFNLQRIQYCKSDSDVIAKIKGTFQERPKRPKMPKSIDDSRKKKNKDANRLGVAPGYGQSGLLNNVNVEQPPNQILFLTNLPDETSEMMLSMLFNQLVYLLCVTFVTLCKNNSWSIESKIGNWCQ